MFKRITVLGGLAALVLGLFAADGRACFFGRRHRCTCAPVVYYYPCPMASSGDARPKTPEEAAAELEDLVKSLAKPLEAMPKLSPEAAKALGVKPEK